jgi:hypothetical protein
MISLNIDLLQLNDLYYAVSKHTKDCEQQIKEYGDSSYFVTQLERAKELETIVQDALYKRCDELDEAIQYIDEVVEKYKDEDDGPEYDSAGFTEDDRIVNGQYRNLDSIAEQREDAKYEKAFSIHFVTNEEADEDAGIKESDKFNGVSQFILDFVEANDVVSYSEMNDMYKAYTKGSNSFSHILKALRIPYKNRPTKRYLVKHHLGGYMVRTATPHNWVVNY